MKHTSPKAMTGEARFVTGSLLHHSRLAAALLLTVLGLSEAKAQGPAPPDQSKVLDDLIQTYRDRAIPPDPSLVYQEIDKLDQLIREWSPYIATRSDAPQKASSLRADVTKWFDAVAAADCNAPDSQRPSQGFADITKKHLGEVYVTETLEEVLREPGDAPSCADLKKFVGAKQQVISEELAKIDEDAKLKASQLEEWSKKAQELVNLLSRRKQQLNDTLAATKARANLANNLWKLIGVIGLLSLGAITLVAMFPPALQIEWVASGQVIQFVTVMVLLSVIMALGLSDILKEESLGTLLGAIAGYVLSQGVGRA
ncbi:MAG TPA: hypothetical protein VFO36_04690, partial [Nitrospiraceae bacterium]|nr:hypothetical protein [Nitrospiraceae bacterium]